MKKQRKHYTPEEKVAILRRHLLENAPISKLCAELGLQPTVFCRRQQEFFERCAAAFEQRRPSSHSADQERIAYLEKKIQTKDEVLAELMAEHVALKNVEGPPPASCMRREVAKFRPGEGCGFSASGLPHDPPTSPQGDHPAVTIVNASGRRRRSQADRRRVSGAGRFCFVGARVASACSSASR
jgi:transposase-like protein